jgi:hypothetical protein
MTAGDPMQQYSNMCLACWEWFGARTAVQVDKLPDAWIGHYGSYKSIKSGETCRACMCIISTRTSCNTGLHLRTYIYLTATIIRITHACNAAMRRRRERLLPAACVPCSSSTVATFFSLHFFFLFLTRSPASPGSC